MSKKKGIKKEHLLIGGAGALALIYILSRGKEGGAPGFGGGGLGDAPGLETITTETITIPAGASDVGGSILLPPPEAGRFFDVPDWVRPDGGTREYAFEGRDYPAYQATLSKKELQKDIVKSIEYRRSYDLPGAVPYALGYVPPGGYKAGIAPPTKKEAIITKPVSLFESIPGSGFVVGAKRLKSFLGDTFF